MKISLLSNRPLRWSAYTIGVVLLIIFISWLTVPYYLKNTIEKQSEAQIGRQMTVGKVAFNPFTLSVNISNIVLLEADKKTPALSVDNVLVRLSLASVPHLAPVVRELVLSHPSLHVVVQENQTNFSDVVLWLAKHPSQGKPLEFALSNIQLINGEILFEDRVKGKKTQIDAITIGLPFISNFPKSVDIFIEPSLSAKIDGSLFEIKGLSKPFIETRETSLSINLDQLDLAKLAEFSPVPLPVKVNSAKLSSKLSLNFIDKKDVPQVTLSGTTLVENVAVVDLHNKPMLKVRAITSKLREVNLTTGNSVVDLLEIDESHIWAGMAPISGELTAKKIALQNVTVQSALKQAKINKIILDKVEGEVSRGSNGTPTKIENKNSSPWLAEINHIALNDSSFVFNDKSKKPAVSVRADAVNATIEQLSSKLDHPIKVAVRGNVNKTGKFAVEGQLDQKSAQLQVEVHDFSVVALQPYFTDYLNITLGKGAVSTTGKLHWNAPEEVAYQGDLVVTNFTSSDKETTDSFLNWKKLQIGGIDVKVGAKQQNITLGTIDLSDFYARAILSDKAKLNLQDVMVQREPDKDTAASSPAVKIGKFTLHNGVINYTDNYIKPRFSMRMTKMNGTVGAIESTNPQAAPINLAGKLNDDAPVAISGTLNPLAKPLVLDIKMTANGIDLPPLTHYSRKYAGYPIEKGKLSLDVEYHVKDNALTAKNTLTLDQLTLGDKITTPGAPDYPLPFLLSLLADRNGRINLDIPISGSINDPQFSLGSIIGKALISMIGRAITAPFSLLAHVFSGGSGRGSEELSYVEFAPGLATLTDAGKTKLSGLAKALTDREKLKLDIIGRADMDADATGLREYKLNRQIRRASELHPGDSRDKPISEEDRASAVAKIYSDAKFDKPRNKLGFAKSLPTKEMESMIVQNTAITEDDLINLANKRGAAVRAYLQETEKIPVERMYSNAPKINDKASEATGKAVTPSRVDFNLKM